MKHKLLIICLDSFRFEYLKQTKFLRSLAQKNQSGQLETDLGYNSAEVSLLTGKRPDQHNVWSQFHYSPQKSPFKLLKLLKPLDDTPLEPPARLAASVLINSINLLKGHTHLYKIPSIPFSAIANFNPTLKNTWVDLNLTPPTFFQILKNKNIPYLCLNWPLKITPHHFSLSFTPNTDKAQVKTFLNSQSQAQVLWLHLWQLDTITHHQGTRSKAVKQKFRHLDQLCKEIIHTASQHHQIKFLFWSDHGMVDVKKTVNLEKHIKSLNLPYFLDSTLARFWPPSKKAKNQLLKKLQKFKNHGYVLTSSEKTKHHINFPHTRYGDVIFLANPGVLIFPNFYQKSTPPKAMHGYDPRHPDQKGFYILSSNKNVVKHQHISQLFPQLTKLTPK